MSKENSSPISKLFGSKTRAKILNLLFDNTDKSYYIREITRVIDEQINSVRRELSNLESIGVVKNETFDNKVYYSANMKHPYAHALHEIFSKKVNLSKDKDVKESGWEEYVKPVQRYLAAMMLTNRLPGQEGIDLLIIGDDKTKKLTHWAELVEKKMGRPINYVIFSIEDFLYRKSVRDRFVLDILEMEVSELIDPDKLIKE